MKKLLACGLILSTLMSFGSVCFAKDPKTPIDDSSDATNSTFIARFEWDTKGRKIFAFDSFVKISDELWRKNDSVPIFNGMLYTSSYQSDKEYQFEVEFDDGSIEVVEFTGSDLSEHADEDLDMGIVCFKSIRVR